VGGIAIVRTSPSASRRKKCYASGAIAFESQSGMIVTDPNSVILRVNRAFTTLTGYSAQEVLGQTPHLLSSGRHDKHSFKPCGAA